MVLPIMRLVLLCICQNSFGKGEMWFCQIEMIGSKKKRVIVEIEKVYTKRRNLANKGGKSSKDIKY